MIGHWVKLRLFSQNLGTQSITSEVHTGRKTHHMKNEDVKKKESLLSIKWHTFCSLQFWSFYHETLVSNCQDLIGTSMLLEMRLGWKSRERVQLSKPSTSVTYLTDCLDEKKKTIWKTFWVEIEPGDSACEASEIRSNLLILANEDWMLFCHKKGE